MRKILLLRHGQTYGNTMQRYVGGRTDEPLTEAGQEEVLKKKKFLAGLSLPSFPEAWPVYRSPMLRCGQTANLLFPNHPQVMIEQLRECDFGLFENKNYQELSSVPEYQEWIDSNATLPFPQGESREDFLSRSRIGLQEVIAQCDMRGQTFAVLVVHGGIIMNLMSSCCMEERDYYSWHVGNVEGYLVRIDEEAKAKDERFLILEQTIQVEKS